MIISEQGELVPQNTIFSPFFLDEQSLKINRSDGLLLLCFAVVLIHPSLIRLQKGRTSNRKIRASSLSSPEKDCNKKKMRQTGTSLYHLPYQLFV